MLSEREILSLVEPLLPNDVGIKFVVSTTNPKRLCLEGIGAARRRTNGEEEDSGDDESKESDDEEHYEIERGDALLDVEIIAGEERGRDVKIAITENCATVTKTRNRNWRRRASSRKRSRVRNRRKK